MGRRRRCGSLDRLPTESRRPPHGADTRNAFRIELEEPNLRERYGMNLEGQSLLLARRLIEAGVGLVSVFSHTNSAWDTHSDHFGQMKNLLLPRDDRATSALLTDLDDRGLLDETLLIWTGDFGRTPKINPNPGRDHWPHCFSMMLAGGGVKRGRVLGKSDAHAAYPAERPVHASDIAATIYHCLGISHETLYKDIFGRELPLCIGQPIWEILEG
jgi:uncharacterized protein (DUF1501 family)